ncbi:MAG: quinone-interacting membrane-bound oxidoreductase complex subunit QmoC [Acidobacteria bacterium]|nr:quinone-interacting membrane-bound oxidoreductase complex subunit QmoC [Acidobacteriota bacterium]
MSERQESSQQASTPSKNTPPIPIEPDVDFIRSLSKDNGNTFKTCMQCGTCSVACAVSPDRAPFPRKEMIWAQWGLKDRLLADPDVWYCHQCNDCSTQCPRGAKPGDLLNAVRQEAVKHYAVPGALGRWIGQRNLVLLLLLPVILLALALFLKDPVWNMGEVVLTYLDHEGFYANLFPHWLLIGFYTFFWGLAMIGGIVGVVRFWQAMKAADRTAGLEAPSTGIISSWIRTIKSILVHDRFGMCTSQASRRTAHLGAFYGFAALFVVTIWAVVALYIINPMIPGHDQDLIYPFAIWSPWKILANLGGIALVIGCVLAILKRRSGADDAPSSSSFDWLFLVLLLVVGVTGLLTEIFRYAAEPGGGKGLMYAAYSVYFVHLVAVFDLLVYLPYSKLAHVLYRTVALVYTEHSGRNQKILQPGT